jgi:hypothetical protein
MEEAGTVRQGRKPSRECETLKAERSQAWNACGRSGPRLVRRTLREKDPPNPWR